MDMPTHIVAAGGIVKNEKQEILMIRHNHSGWVFPGGQVEAGENLPDAVMREIMEECGVAIDVEQLVCISSNTTAHPGYNGVKTVPTKVMLDFTCRYLKGAIRPSEENSETAWVPKDKVLSRITAPAYRERFIAYLEFNGRICYLEYNTHPEWLLRMKRYF